MLPHSARTVRVLLTTCLSFSIALSALTPSPRCCDGEKLEPTCCAAVLGACCCTASNDRRCGTACCAASSPAVPEQPVQPPKARTEQPDAPAETPRSGLPLVGEGVCASTRAAFNRGGCSIQGSLQILRVRLEI